MTSKINEATLIPSSRIELSVLAKAAILLIFGLTLACLVRSARVFLRANQIALPPRLLSQSSALSALGMANHSDLSNRASAILDGHRHRWRAGLLTTASVILVAGFLVLAISPVCAAAQSPVTQKSDLQNKEIKNRCSSQLDQALYKAAEDGDVSEINRLLGVGANINCVIEGDGSPLIGAARNGHLEAVGLLLDRGGDPNLAVLGDGNPLIMAAREGQANVVTLLLDRGARIDEVVPGDENALIQASGSGQLAVVKILVSRGADVNRRVWVDATPWQKGEWRTPLNMARRGKHNEVVTFLLASGAKE